MSKAVLILDEMPKNCFTCKFRDFNIMCCGETSEVTQYCSWTSRNLSPSWRTARPDDCPLKEMPERITAGKYIDFPHVSIAPSTSFADGWNYCLKKIGGGDE